MTAFAKETLYSDMSDREIIMIIAERQSHHLESQKSLVEKVEKIENKILEDVETRVRNLEDERLERRGMIKGWLAIVGLISLVSAAVSIYVALK